MVLIALLTHFITTLLAVFLPLLAVVDAARLILGEILTAILAIPGARSFRSARPLASQRPIADACFGR
jgi:hypothetical protein